MEARVLAGSLVVEAECVSVVPPIKQGATGRLKVDPDETTGGVFFIQGDSYQVATLGEIATMSCQAFDQGAVSNPLGRALVGSAERSKLIQDRATLTVTLKNGQDIDFILNGVSEYELSRLLGPLLAPTNVKLLGKAEGAPHVPSPPLSVDQLVQTVTQLAQLHDAGQLTDTEFQSLKARAMGSSDDDSAADLHPGPVPSVLASLVAPKHAAATHEAVIVKRKSPAGRIIRTVIILMVVGLIVVVLWPTPKTFLDVPKLEKSLQDQTNGREDAGLTITSVVCKPTASHLTFRCVFTQSDGTVASKDFTVAADGSSYS